MSSPKDIFTADLKPTGDPKFTGVFVRMWIAGTMGAYFTFLFRNLALDIPTFSIHEADWPYTLVVWIRYAYLLWFLAYFFGSNVSYERNKEILSAWEVGFDVTQAVIGIIAAFFLGFIVRAADGATSWRCAVAAANGAIALICLFSLICFGWRQKPEEDGRKLNILRWCGFVSSSLAFVLVILAAGVAEGGRVWLLGLAAAFGAVPFFALVCFIRNGWKPGSTGNAAGVETTVKDAAPKPE